MSSLSSAPPRPKLPHLADLDLVIATARLRLRPLAESDVDDLWPYVSDPELPRMMSWAAHTERSQTAGFIRHVQQELASDAGVTWAIEHAGRAVGCVGLASMRFATGAWRVDRAELGYWIAPPLSNQGLMTEAAHAAVRYGFDTIGLHKVTVSSVIENLASRRVIEKLGFRHTGRSDDDVWRDGRWWSMLRYELTAGEWSDLSTTLRITRVAPP